MAETGAVSADVEVIDGLNKDLRDEIKSLIDMSADLKKAVVEASATWNDAKYKAFSDMVDGVVSKAEAAIASLRKNADFLKSLSEAIKEYLE